MDSSRHLKRLKNQTRTRNRTPRLSEIIKSYFWYENVINIIKVILILKARVF